ncbi:MAG: histidine phosphatase family protein, partial [Pirellulaceae bacterium]|nr:histidine phosphatase family protein [Pirellulaceae bacterium]
YLIRHAQSRNNSLPEEQRCEDPPITELGTQQVAHLAKWIHKLHLSQIFVSPFLRTLQTAAPLAEATGLAPRVRVELHEKGGCYSGYDGVGKQGASGMSGDQIRELFPQFELDEPINGAGWWAGKPYETVGQARRRADLLLQRAVAEFADSDERIAYVMHADIKLLCLELVAPQFIVPRNTSVTSLQVSSGGCRLVEYNQVGHLPLDLHSS